jgi:hypothetical protein
VIRWTAWPRLARGSRRPPQIDRAEVVSGRAVENKAQAIEVIEAALAARPQ